MVPSYNSQTGKMTLGSSRSAGRSKRMMGQPDQGGLSTRAASPVGGKKNRGNRSAPSGQLTADDMIKIFQSMPVPNRGFKNPNASQPAKMGQGMAWFDANNSPEQVAGRQQRVDTARQKELNGNFVDAATAVDFAKQTKGYTNASGQFVPPTMPSAPSSAYGSGSVSFTDKPTQGTMIDPATGQKVFMDQYLPNQSMVQDTKFGPMDGQENGGALARPRSQPQNQPPATPTRTPASDMDSLFPGGAGPKQGVAQVPPTFSPSLPMDTPGRASEMSRKASPFLPQGQNIADSGFQLPQITQNGIVPDLWNSGNSFLAGLGDLYSNNVGRPLDQLLFGIQPPAQPSNNMQQYQKAKGIKQGWW